jgi:uncharacterized membrane protein YgdD (TMEM256/DUF423 family)
MALVKALAMALVKALAKALFFVGVVQFKGSIYNMKVNILADLYHPLQHG